MTAFTLFSPFVKPYIFGNAPNSLLVDTIKKTTIDFCKRTLVYRETSTPITILAATSEYAIPFTPTVSAQNIIYAKIGTTYLILTDEGELNEYEEAWRDNTAAMPTDCFLTHKGLIRVYPTPSVNLTDTMTVEAIVAPTFAATDVDDMLFNDYADVIGAGAIFKLKSMVGSAWEDQTGALLAYREYRAGIRDARARILQNRKISPMEVNARSFGEVD